MNSVRPSQQQGRPASCVYCKGDHFSASYSKVWSPEDHEKTWLSAN